MTHIKNILGDIQRIFLFINIIILLGEVKFTPEQAMKAQMGSSRVGVQLHVPTALPPE